MGTSRFGLDGFAETVRACRSYRRFDEKVAVPHELLLELVDLARQVSSGANRQPLRYRLVTAPAECEAVFAQLAWAGALTDWDGPEPGERPAAYVVVCDAGCGATTAVDEGIAAQTLLLGATQAGFGGCMLHAFNKKRVAEALGLPAEAAPLMVIALGKPAETVVLDSVGADGSTTYWRDAASVHHVPKRSLDEILL